MAAQDAVDDLKDARQHFRQSNAGLDDVEVEEALSEPKAALDEAAQEQQVSTVCRSDEIESIARTSVMQAAVRFLPDGYAAKQYVFPPCDWGIDEQKWRILKQTHSPNPSDLAVLRIVCP